MSNHYAALGVLPTASAEEIKASYRQLAKRHHPDRPAGDARSFARIQDAYEVLADAQKRRAYDAEAHAKAGALRAQAAARAAGGSRSPLPVLTRIMSLTVPRSGRFQLQGLIGDIRVVATTPESLWDTTLRKYRSTEPERLARHVIQIKLSGEPDLVRSLMPRPTDFGVEFQRATTAEKRHRLRTFLENLLGGGTLGGLFAGQGFGLYGARLPLTLQVTVPPGTALHLRDVTGAISVGNVDCDVVAKLLGGVLHTGRIGRAHLTLNGGSRAFITDARGPVDLVGFGNSRTFLGGRIPRLRTVLENRARAEVIGIVEALQAEVHGHASLELRRPVPAEACDVRGDGQVRLTRAPALRPAPVTGHGDRDLARPGPATATG